MQHVSALQHFDTRVNQPSSKQYDDPLGCVSFETYESDYEKPSQFAPSPIEPLGSPLNSEDWADYREDSVLKVGQWTFSGSMNVIYDGSVSLANSTVKMGHATSPAMRKSQAIRMVIKSVKLGEDAEGEAMIRREAATLRELGDSHPHILPMLFCMELPNEITILTRYAPAGDLSMCIPPFMEVNEFDVRQLTLQLLSALSHLHGHRIIHGDVKPENIFLTEIDGALLAQISDFGLSVWLPENRDFVELDNEQGSYGYIPAEVLSFKQISCAADLFALGVIAFRYLGGHDPFYPPSNVMSAIEFDECTWQTVSQSGRTFATQLLSQEPAERGAAVALLQAHPWLQNGADLSGTRVESRPSKFRFHDLASSRSIWVNGQLAKC